MNSEWLPLELLTTRQLLDNLNFLKEWFPEIHHLLTHFKPSETLVFQVDEGLFRCQRASSPAAWVFGEKSPQDELETLQADLSQLSSSSTLIVLAGSSLGYALLPLLPSLHEISQRKILVMEPSVERLKVCLSLLDEDLRQALKTGRLHFEIAAPSLRSIFHAIEKFNCWDEIDPVLYVTPSLRSLFAPEPFLQEYTAASTGSKSARQDRLNRLHTLRDKKTQRAVHRVLIVDFWGGMPQGIHAQSLQNALQKRSIQTRLCPLNHLRVATHPGEYAREVQKKFLVLLDSFAPDLVLSFAYHAPHVMQEEFFSALGIPWVQIVSNLAFFDQTYFPGEVTAVIEKNLIPLYQQRGAKNVLFVPIMADYVARHPTPTDRRYPVVFVGNSLGLSPDQLVQFHQQYQNRDRLLSYLHEAEAVIGDFDRGINLYAYLQYHPVPQVDTPDEQYDVFRYLLCQATARRRRELLEKITPFNLVLYGFWANKLPPDSPLHSHLHGELPIHQEQSLFSRGDIFLNIHSVGHVTGPNMRFFNNAGMGAFQITDGEFGDYLHEGTEAVYFKSTAELIEKIRHYLEHEEERDAIRTGGLERVKREWTYNHWLDRVFQALDLQT